MHEFVHPLGPATGRVSASVSLKDQAVFANAHSTGRKRERCNVIASPEFQGGLKPLQLAVVVNVVFSSSPLHSDGQVSAYLLPTVQFLAVCLPEQTGCIPLVTVRPAEHVLIGEGELGYSQPNPAGPLDFTLETNEESQFVRASVFRQDASSRPTCACE